MVKPHSALTPYFQYDQLMPAWQRIKKERGNSKSLRKKIATSKRVTLGMLVKEGSHRLGQKLFYVVKEKTKQKVDAICTRIKKAKETHQADINKCHATLKSEPVEIDWSPNSKWIIKDRHSILKPLKHKKDGAMPAKKEPILLLYTVFLKENHVCIPFDSSIEDDTMTDTNENNNSTIHDADDNYCEI